MKLWKLDGQNLDGNRYTTRFVRRTIRVSFWFSFNFSARCLLLMCAPSVLTFPCSSIPEICFRLASNVCSKVLFVRCAGFTGVYMARFAFVNRKGLDLLLEVPLPCPCPKNTMVTHHGIVPESFGYRVDCTSICTSELARTPFLVLFLCARISLVICCSA